MAKTYKISFDLYVTSIWIEDGLTCSTLKRRIPEELPSMLCNVAYGDEIVVKNIKVNLKK